MPTPKQLHPKLIFQFLLGSLLLATFPCILHAQHQPGPQQSYEIQAAQSQRVEPPFENQPSQQLWTLQPLPIDDAQPLFEPVPDEISSFESVPFDFTTSDGISLGALSQSAGPYASSPQTGDQATEQKAPGAEEDFNAEHRIISTFFHDEYRMWTAPFRPRGYNRHAMLGYGLPFLVVTGALLATDTHLEKHLSTNGGVDRVSTRISQIGAPYTDFAIGGITYAVGRFTHNDHARETGFLAMEALAHAELVGEVMKYVFQRQRPSVPSANAGFWEHGTSFPSGHALGAFSVATVFAREYRDQLAVPIVAYSLATLVSLSRLSAKQHWPSDVFVGAAGGVLIGRYVYKEHHDPCLPGDPGYHLKCLRPDIALTGAGVSLNWKF